MDEQREQPKDERPEVAGEVDEADLEQAAGGAESLSLNYEEIKGAYRQRG